MSEPFYLILAVVAAVLLSAAAVYWVGRLRGRRTTKSDLHKKTAASGIRGEENLLMDVRRFTRLRHAKILTNLYVRGNNGRMTEVDLVLLDRNGIFVFESKNYNGAVYGEEQNREWLHVLRNGDRFNFYNPIWQNRGHISAVRRLCDGLDPEYFKSIIVFGKNCVFKKLRVHNSDCMIVKAGGAARAFRVLGRNTKNALSWRDIQDYYDRLLPYSRSTKRMRRQHAREVRKRK